MAARPSREAGVMAVAPPPCRPGPPPPSPQDPAPRLNETEWGPRFPIGSSAATLENARYTAAGPPSMDHPNEDRFFAMEGGDFQVMAVFDGHDGARAAGFASNFVLSLFGTQSWRQLVRHGREHINHALQEFFLAAEKEFFQSIERHTHEWEQLRTALPAGLSSYQAYQRYPSQVSRLQQLEPRIGGGSTAVLAVVCGGCLFVANVGDSRAVLVYERSDGTLATEQLSHDHTVDSEAELCRLERLGLDRRQLQRCGRLGTHECTRSIGDYSVKRGYRDVDALRNATEAPGSAQPHLLAPLKILPSHRYLLLMSDGVYKSIEETYDDGVDAHKMLVQVVGRIQGGVAGGVAAAPGPLLAEHVLRHLATLHHDRYQKSAAVDITAPAAVACRKRDDMTLVVYKFPPHTA